jgi:hypothetical protein
LVFVQWFGRMITMLFADMQTRTLGDGADWLKVPLRRGFHLRGSTGSAGRFFR